MKKVIAYMILGGLVLGLVLMNWQALLFSIVVTTLIVWAVYQVV